MSPSVYDAVIVGGGPAGCAAALALSRSNPSAEYLIIDDSDPSDFKIGESLPAEATRLLSHLHPDLPRKLESATAIGLHYTCSGNASAWASSEVEDRHSILNPFGNGWHLDRAAFDQLLRDTVSSTTAIRGEDNVMKGTVSGIERQVDETWQLRIARGSEVTAIRTNWIVDATGRRASIATKLGAKTIIPDPLLSFYATFESPTLALDPSQIDNDHRTIIEAVPSGWFYTSLVPSASEYTSTRVVAYHTHPSHTSAKTARRRDGTGLLELLEASSTHISSILRTSRYELSTPGSSKGQVVSCTAAGSSYLDKPCDVRQKWIAVGDAAMAFDPLSSQGMMTALEMGYCVGLLLGSKLLGKGFNASLSGGTGLEQVYGKVRGDYETARQYYYDLGRRRFAEESFWVSSI